MKPKILFVAAALGLLASFAFGQNPNDPPTAFTYQGRLNDGAAPANGAYDLTFSVWTNSSGPAQLGGTITNSATAVSNGFFTVTLDFGAGIFTGPERWLEIGVRTNGGGAFTNLTPRQRFTSTPYATTAANVTGVVPNTSLAGTYSNAVTFNNAANQFTGSFTGNGGGLSNVSAQTLGGFLASSFWQLNGNNVLPGQFLGSTNNQPVEIRVNGQRAMRYEPTSDTPNVVGGWNGNYVLPGLSGVTIGGGGTIVPFNGSPQPNIVTSNGNYATIAGGYDNTVQGYGGVIGGGSVNSVVGNFGFIGGGQFQTIDADAGYSVIGGGYQNLIQSNNFEAVIVGGYQNVIQSTRSAAFVGGGFYNQISSGGDTAVIVGGYQNTNNTASAFIGGGHNNVIDLNVDNAAIVAGVGNGIQFGSGYSFIGGGDHNLIQTNSGFSVIAGGQGNSIATNASWATIGGGTGNNNSGRYATIGGGLNNSAAAFQSTIGGGVVNSIGTNSPASTIGGGQGNAVAANTAGIFIGGGSRNTVGPGALQGTIAGGVSNSIFNLTQPAIVGGRANSMEVNGHYSFIGGGVFNTNRGYISLIGGGQNNTVDALADHSVIAGGGFNRVIGSQLFEVYATIGGGQSNLVQTNATYPTIGGGLGNTVRSNAQYATIPGGASNSVAGRYSFAAGQQANALHDGTFVWADANDTNFSSSTSNQFLIRASGGVGIGKTNPATALDVNGVVTASGFSGSGSGLTSVNANTLGGLANSSFWKTTGNAGTTPGVNFLGTTDNQPVELKVNSVRALRLEPIANDVDHSNIVNIVGGSPVNFVAPGVVGATIGGGGAAKYFGFANTNSVSADFGTVAGGIGNTSDAYATVGGGLGNAASAYGATIGGGVQNKANYAATVAGGQGNTSSGNWATVSGGLGNQSSSVGATVSGGVSNTNSASYATIPGGAQNLASGDYSFAAGQRAKATHTGSFVWADSQAADFNSTSNNQFNVRAANGVRLNTDTSLFFGSGAKLWPNQGGAIELGDSLSSGVIPYIDFHYGFGSAQDFNVRIINDGSEQLSIFRFGSGTRMAQFSPAGLSVNGTFVSVSDRNAKENFKPINSHEVLDKVAALPIARWNFKQDTSSEHIGPMAQDFYAAFGVGPDDKHIATVDADGVALAAIQALHQLVKERESEIAGLKTRLEKLEQFVQESINSQNRGAQ